MKQILPSLFIILSIYLPIKTTAQFFGGNGTENNPWQITTVQELDSVRHHLNGYYILINDLDFAGTEYDSINSSVGWNPIGEETSWEYYFRGNFNGNGHTIYNLYINRPELENVGLFGFTEDATIKNLNILSCSVEGKDNTGGIVGTATNTTFKQNCVYGTITSNSNAGGIAGWLRNESNIQSCYTAGNIQGKNYIGGITGKTIYSDIQNCYTACTIIATNTDTIPSTTFMGGITGELETTTGTTISNCYSVSSVGGNKNGNIEGGIAGSAIEGNIFNTYFCGEFTGTQLGIGTGSSTSYSQITNRNYEEMVQSNYPDFNDTIWNISSSNSLPTLLNVTNYPIILNKGCTITSVYEEFTDTILIQTMDYAGNYNITLQDSPDGMIITQDSIINWTPTEFGIYNYTINLTDEYDNVFSRKFIIHVIPYTQTGTLENPYQITNIAELNYVRNLPDKYFVLSNDLDFAGTVYDSIISDEGWNPICTEHLGFTGHFDGQGHYISNMYINRPELENVGLFGFTEDATIKNLNILSCSVEGKDNTGGIVGTATNTTFKQNCVYGTITSNSNAGGIAGSLENESNIQSCYTAGNIQGKNYIGGITGKTIYSDIQNCYTACTIIATNTDTIPATTCMGGITGKAQNSATISKCYSIGSVWGNKNGNIEGGIVGYNGTESISNTYFCGEFAGTQLGIGKGQSPYSLIVNRSYEEMLESYNSNFNDTIWNISSSNSLPTLLNVTNYPIILNKGCTITSVYEEFTDTIFIQTMDYTGNYNITLQDSPDGMIITQDSIINWTPTEFGIYNYTINLTDEYNKVFSRKFIINVVPYAQTGTVENPYQINNIAELNYVRNLPDKHYVLNNDLDFTGTVYDSINSNEGWKPIGCVNDEFTGSFNGKNHIIENLYINRPNDAAMGLFSRTKGAEIDSLVIRQININALGQAAGLIGYSEESNINNCNVTGNITSVFAGNTGLLIGISINTNIQNSSTQGNITLNGDNCGGLIGSSDHSDITNCFSSINISSVGNNHGGLIGLMDNYSNITNGFSSINISCTGNNHGGLVGLMDGHSDIINAYTSGTIHGEGDFYGGLVGNVESGSIDQSYSHVSLLGFTEHNGGFVGKNHYGNITDCYATGNVYSINGYSGGFVGENSFGNIINCYSTGFVDGSHSGGFSSEFSSRIENCHFISKTSNLENGYYSTYSIFEGETIAQFKQDSTFDNWDFNDIWTITNGETFPRLQEIYNPPIILNSLDLANVNQAYSDTIMVIPMDAEIMSILIPTAPEGMILEDSILSWIPDSAAMYNIEIIAQDINEKATHYLEKLEVAPFNGEGTSENPFQIWTVEQLDSIRHRPDKCYSLMTDLNFTESVYDSISSPEGWLPINDFGGQFNGHGHTISDLYINRINLINVGLFGICEGAQIDSLGLLNTDIKGRHNVGCLAGNTKNTSITHCYASGLINCDGIVGGLIGYSLNNTSINECYASTCINSTGNYAGGLVGANTEYSSITNSYATGFIQGIGNYFGGLVGGNLSNAQVSGSYATGKTKSSTMPGGLIGKTDNLNVFNCYFDSISTNQPVGIDYINYNLLGITALSPDQFKNQNNFNGWDFENTWEITEGETYPRLQALSDLPIVLYRNKSSKIGNLLTDTVCVIPMDENILSVSLAKFPEGMQIQDSIIQWIPDSLGLHNYSVKVIDIAGNDVTYSDLIHVVPFNGFGTTDNPYTITNIDELNYIRHLLDKHFIQLNDLDFSNTQFCNDSSALGWDPIGLDGISFTGSYNGNDFEILNLYINRPDDDNVGLFLNTIGGDFKNIRISNCEITGNNKVGALTSNCSNYSTINNCHASGQITGEDIVGGLIGEISNTLVANSSANIHINANEEVGGLIGVCKNSSMVTYCDAGNTIAATGYYVGMLVGKNHGSTIKNSYSKGTISGNWIVGGLVGLNIFDADINNSYSSCNTNSINYSGGLVGENAHNSTITNCYATGTATSDSISGGMVGLNYYASMDSCYSCCSGYGSNYYSGGGLLGDGSYTALSSNLYFNSETIQAIEFLHYSQNLDTTNILNSEQMLFSPNFPNLNFIEHWTIDEGVSFPKLQNIYNTPIVLKKFEFKHIGESFQDSIYIIPMDADILSVTLLEGPEGMLLEDSILFWTPDTLGKFDFTIKAEDINGEYTIYTNKIAVVPFDGIGTTEEPFEVNSLQELDYIRHYPDRKYILTDNIDFYNENNPFNIENWTPIGTQNIPFTGIFEGNEFNINHLSINSNYNYVGLFGSIVNAELQNIELINANIESDHDFTGALVGMSNSSIINKCCVSGNVTGTNFVGGLAGFIEQTEVHECYSTGIVSGFNIVGGLIGKSSSNLTSISNCYTTSDIHAEEATSNKVGGFIGSNYSEINNCYSAGFVQSTEEAGGFAGYNNYYNGSFEACFYDSQVAGVNYAVAENELFSFGYPTSLLKQEESFQGWDFINTWGIIEGQTYPYLLAIDNAPFAFGDTIEPGTSGSFIANDLDAETLQTNLIYEFESDHDYTVVDGVITCPEETAKIPTIDVLNYKIGEVRLNDTLWGNYSHIVFPANNPPVVIPNQYFTIDENTTSGTSLGYLSAYDADQDTTLGNWTITNGNINDTFTLDSLTGELLISNNTPLDYETNPVFILNVTVSDALDTSANEIVTIYLNNINDNIPVITENQVFHINENAESILNIGIIEAFDPDGSESFFDWTIISGNDLEYFSINSETGELQLIDHTGLDYETTQSYTLGITVRDSIFTSDTCPIMISILNINESIPTINEGQVFSILENSPNQTVVGNIQASDDDLDTQFSEWTIISGNIDNIFSINETTGQIIIENNVNLDFENSTYYELTLTVTDGLYTSNPQTVSIEIIDQNDNSPYIELNQNFVISENSDNETVVGYIEVIDVDQNSNFTDWTILSGNENNIFLIDNTTQELVISDNSNLDFETTTSYELLITVSDGIFTSTPSIISIEITDYNDNNPVITPSQVFSINENAFNNSTIGTVSAFDIDEISILENWMISSGNVDNIFSINSTTGTLRVQDSTNLNYESATSHQLTITVSDGMHVSNPEIIMIEITDINDNPPVILPSQVFSVDDNIGNGSSIGFVTAEDIDTSTEFIDWNILDGNTNDVFTISSSGELLVTNNSFLDYELQSEYNLNLSVSDGTFTSETEEVTIQVIDCSRINNSEHKIYHVYPNPVTDKVYFDMLNVDIKTINVIDITGRILISEPCNNAAYINVGKLSKGPFVLKLTFKDGSIKVFHLIKK